ncbi:MAG: hypothetical protein MK052_07365 [Alphaproteobacteria bacterium]|nr:hypothetical protein [Alphaproteobacteria bacterium]
MFDYSQKIDQYARMLLPAICTLLLLLFSLLRIGFAGLAHFPIDVCLISIYYWTIFRPSTMPFWFVFILGIVRDSLMGTPLGISSLVFILFRLIILSQQRYLVKETFWATWFGFGWVLVPALVFNWLLSSAYAKSFIPITPVMMQWVFTFGLYPLLHIVFNALYGFLPDPSGRAKQAKLL